MVNAHLHKTNAPKYAWYYNLSGVECTDTMFGLECGPCPYGNSGNGTKNNCIETCELDPCYEGVRCTDTNTGPVCGDCPVGWQGDGIECIDIDEVRI